MAKTGSVNYGIITDTHGYPSGRRERITSGQYAEKYLFDLGDNTMSASTFDSEPVEEISGADMILYGNHDTYQNGGLKKGLQTLLDSTNKVIIFGLDSCTAELNIHKLETSQIIKLAETLEGLAADWDVIVLTHIPLFDPNSSVTGICWNESKPQHTDELLDILEAYHTHSSCTYSETIYNYTSKTGHVIGCFCGHVHNGFTCADKGIYMEAFTTNGAETYLPSGNTDGNNAGMYTPDIIRISINFSTQKVNGESYINPDETYRIRYTSHPTNDIGQQAFGSLVLGASSNYYPKFLSDGTYLGWGDSASGGPSDNAFSRWQIDSGVIMIGNNTTNASHIRWGSNGLLRFYTTSASVKDSPIPNYDNTSVVFVSNGIHWRFLNGKYIHPQAEQYKFKASSSSYPAFDSEGYYVGWSNEAGGYLIGGLSSTTSSRTWELVDSGTTRVYQNGVHVAAAVQIRFDTDGRLSGFIRSTGTIYSDVTGTIEIMTNGVKWTFYNRLFQSAVSGDSIVSNYTASDQRMDYTTTSYYMTYEDGYLLHYRRTDDPASTQRTDIAGSWASNRTVKFYANATNAYRDVSMLSSKTLTNITFAENSNGFYITTGSFSASYSYARIDTSSNTYYFKRMGTQWLMIDIYRG